MHCLTRETRSLVVAAAVMAVAGMCAAQTASVPRFSPVLPANVVDDAEERLLSLALDTGVPKETREQAARSLLNDQATAASIELAANALRTSASSLSIEPLLMAADGLSLVPDALVDPLTRCAENYAALAPRIARLFAKSESRAALPWLVHTATSTNMQPVRLSARQSLLKLAGATAPAQDDADGWRDWLSRVQAISEAEWLTLRLRTIAASSAETTRLLSRTGADLTQARRRLYLALPAGERAPLLAEWLTDRAPAGRGVALELMLRELAAGTSIDPSLALSIVPLLKSDAAAERADAARVLARLAPEGAGKAIAGQLANESDGSAIEAMLASLVAWPGELSDQDLERWLSWSAPAHAATLDIALGKLRRGELNDERLRSITLDAARSRIASDPTPAACHLLVILGTDDDRVIVSRLLQDSRPAMRYAAAESLVTESGYVVPIAIAAANDPALTTLATRAFVLHQPTIESFRLLFAMGGDAQQRVQQLTLLANMMPARDVAQAIDVIGPDPTQLDRILSTFENPNRLLSETQDDTQLESIARGLLVLAQARLELSKPDAALTALQSLPHLDVYADAVATTRTFLACWLALGRLDDARAMKADSGAWLDAIGVIKGQSISERQRVLQAFTSDFAENLNDSQKARLDALQSRLAADQAAAAAALTSPNADGRTTQDSPR